MACEAATNVADHRRCASGARNEIDGSSRRSVHLHCCTGFQLPHLLPGLFNPGRICWLRPL